ncbi:MULTISPECIES: toxin-antitoxin system HicB family antitoxin [Actinoalloteichus]|uniref:HicB family protein n=1 Tax=Actinoalloteichus fjordicus TaxID=1612552 RepID=A0AAC9PRC4_9PSEU|nr:MULTISPECIES: toxin-antitoxin system HicB family antitoxin [Actinoalloteichus]APU13958.1 HicB family protein [Actinoalloteichus fjordicus]APU19904.1 HicB family protein [Actinoalloteichus sp. GBA129-24]
MDLTPYVEQLRQDLTAATSTADEQTRRTAALLAASLQPAARLALMNALSDLAAEVTAALDDDVVDVRLAGRDVQVVVTRTTPEPADDRASAPPPPPPPPPPLDGGDISRITLRLFDELKSKAEKAASTQGVSLNSWVSQAVQGALHGHGQRGRSWDGSENGDQSEAGSQQSRPESESRTRLRGWVQG